jgi:hypothetical protein
LLIEWPSSEQGPTKYWLSTLPADTKLRDLVRLAKHRWIIERDYEELKQELGLGHYEGGGWRGFHHSCHLVHRRLWVSGGGTEPLNCLFDPVHRNAAEFHKQCFYSLSGKRLY